MSGCGRCLSLRYSDTLHGIIHVCPCSITPGISAANSNITSRNDLHNSSRIITGHVRNRVRGGIATTKVRVVRTHVACLTCTPRVTTIVLRHRRTDTVVSTHGVVISNTINVIRVTLSHLDRGGIIRLSSRHGTTVISGLLIILYNGHSTRPVIGDNDLC